MSVAQLLGGQVRDQIKVYSRIGGDRPADTAVAAQATAARGFTAIKMNATEELQMIDSWHRVQAALPVDVHRGAGAARKR
jgi:galactonate dehydratase